MNIRKTLYITIAAVLLVSGTLDAQNRNRKTVTVTPEQILMDAVTLIDNGDWQKAGSMLTYLTENQPDNDAAWYYLGTCCLYAGDFSGAQKALRKAASIDPKNYWYKDRLATAYSMSGETDMTVATYEAMLEEFPDKDDIRYSLVNIYIQLKEYDKALKVMEDLEKMYGKNENITATRYDILLRQGKTDAALRTLMDFNSEFSSPRILSMIGDHENAEGRDSLALSRYLEALELQSNYAPALLGKADILYSRRDISGFFSCLDKFVSDEETLPSVKAQYLNMLITRNGTLFLNNHKEKLEALYETLVSMAPTDSTILNAGAVFHYSTGRTDKAKDLLHRNLKAHPESFDANIMYIQILGSLDDWEGISSVCDSAITRFPEKTDFLEYQNIAAYHLGDYERIIDNSWKIISMSPGDTAKIVSALSSIGDTSYSMGDEKTAFKCYDKALRLNPDYAPVLNNYAWYLSTKGKKLKKACAMSKKTVDKEPDNPTYLDTYGWILHLLGEDKEAKSLFKHAMLYGGKDSYTILKHYSLVLEALGEKELAELYGSMAEKIKGEED